jgi:hypothetical protein
MFSPANYPFLVFVVSLATCWLSAYVGFWLSKSKWKLQEKSRADFKFVLGGALTLLGLIVGFTFSMAVGRYEQRKNYEEEEANAIGTEYLRADLLAAPDAAIVRSLLTNYLSQRINDFKSRERPHYSQIDVETTRLQNRMWAAASGPATAQPTPVTALVVAGMNDVLNSQGYSQAAMRNRVPIEAWALLVIISMFCNLMIGYGAEEKAAFVLLVLPVVLSISLFLIADIDSPGGGLIHIRPYNLESLAESLHPAAKQ